MAKTGLEEFRDVITDFKSVTSWSVNTAVAAPLADFALHLGPPWPPGVPVITSLVELVTLIAIFQFSFGRRQKRFNKQMILTLALLVLSLSAYLFLFNVYTFKNPSTGQRYAKGFVIRPEIQALIPAYFSTPEEALKGSEYEPTEVWTAKSVTGAQMALLVGWLCIFVSLCAFIGTFVMSQRRRHLE